MNKLKLRWKVFAYVILFAALVIAVFCVFQIFMLDTFYQKTKTTNARNVIEEASNVVATINSFEKLNDSSLHDLALKNEVSIYVISSVNGEIPELQTVFGDKSTYFDKIILNFKKIIDSSTSQKSNIFYISFTNTNPLPTDKFGEGPFIDNNQMKTSADDDLILAKYVNIDGFKTSLLIIDSRLTTLEPAKTTLKQQLLYISIIVVVLSIAVALVISANISRPINKMTLSAKRLAKGARNIKFEGKGYKEITELNQTLNYAVSELNKTDTLQKELLANISHDLKTPLTLIGGYAEMMKDMPSEISEENLQLIVDETSRLNVLVNDLVNLSRLQAKTEVFNFEKLNLTNIIKAIVDRTNMFHEKDGMHINFNFTDDLFIEADAHKIEQVIYNFITNAINYSGESKTIDVLIDYVNSDQVKVTVKDYGIGIGEEELKVVWNRYYRVDKGHARSKEGSGLGLSIVKEILESHQYEYGVNSVLGKGSEFYFIAKLIK